MNNSSLTTSAPPVVWNGEAFLDALGQTPLPVEQLTETIQKLYAQGEQENGHSASELLQDALADAGHLCAALLLLGKRLAWMKDPNEFRVACRQQAVAIVGRDRDRRAYADSVGFEDGLPLQQCLHRLQVLTELAPDVLCYDKTWGFGVVKRVDPFYKKVKIDFSKKKHHEMTFEYAGETLQILDDEHLLAKKYRDPDAMTALLRSDPAEVVKICLRSYGPMSILLVQEHLVPDFVSEQKWKSFWDLARKSLKQDPLVEIPTKRSEPIRLRSGEMQYDKSWFDALRKERSLKTILARVRELIDEDDLAALSPHAVDVLKDRLAFTMLGARGAEPGTLANAIMVASLLPESAQPDDMVERVDEFLEPQAFVACADQLSARDLKTFIEFLRTHDEEGAGDLFLSLITSLPLSVLNDVMDSLEQMPHAADVGQIVKMSLDAQFVSIDLMAWLAKHMDKVSAWSLGALPLIANVMLRSLEMDHPQATARGKNQLRSQFESLSWQRLVLAGMTDKQRREFLLRVKDTSAFSMMDRRSILGKMIKLFPDLENELVSNTTQDSSVRVHGSVTSERSYKERQDQLEHLTKVEIPQNSKEIGIARSYGDLKENHEFKAAKEMQAILLRREGELQEMLTRVKPTNFEGYPADVVGIGVGVQIRYEDERTEWFYILGEWDRDEDLGIISSETLMATTLQGHKVGDRLTVPSRARRCARVKLRR